MMRKIEGWGAIVVGTAVGVLGSINEWGVGAWIAAAVLILLGVITLERG